MIKTATSIFQVLLDLVFGAFRFTANQRPIRILERFRSSCHFRRILLAIHHRHQHCLACQLRSLHLGVGQEPQTIRLEYGVFGDQELLAPVSLLVIMGLPEWRVRQLRKRMLDSDDKSLRRLGNRHRSQDCHH